MSELAPSPLREKLEVRVTVTGWWRGTAHGHNHNPWLVEGHTPVDGVDGNSLRNARQKAGNAALNGSLR